MDKNITKPEITKRLQKALAQLNNAKKLNDSFQAALEAEIQAHDKTDHVLNGSLEALGKEHENLKAMYQGLNADLQKEKAAHLTTSKLLDEALKGKEKRWTPFDPEAIERVIEKINKRSLSIEKLILVEKLKESKFVMKVDRGEIKDATGKARIAGEEATGADILNEMTQATGKLLENHQAGAVVEIKVEVTVY